MIENTNNTPKNVFTNGCSFFGRIGLEDETDNVINNNGNGNNNNGNNIYDDDDVTCY